MRDRSRNGAWDAFDGGADADDPLAAAGEGPPPAAPAGATRSGEGACDAVPADDGSAAFDEALRQLRGD